MKRNKTIKVRVNEDEFSALYDRKVGRELAGWMRSVCLKEPIANRIFSKTDPDLLQKHIWVGRLLSSIATNCSAADLSNFDKIKILIELRSIKKKLRSH